ncbi:hypothetical protein BSKO_13327 [Bryopsis sp. KO-2023]|nr:hypothetical protein BSKO_13327 [Bryopsis sp. KO-2023]
MGAARKLQAEIDRTLKKVQEGINEFDEIWNKVYDTDNQNQREKYEADLKKEIKKLQRLRDQIKTWIASSDIKDKTLLLEARKAIEREMERFKVCEKEAKTKAFSKAGLGLAAKLDPEEKARQEARDWLNEQVEALQIQIDEFEAELESLGGPMHKKSKARPHRIQCLEESVDRHKSHIMRLEQVMRCLDNDTICADEVEEQLKEMVEWYVSENQEDPVVFEVVDDTYGDLIDKLNAAALGVQPPPLKVKKSIKDQEEVDEKERERERERERAAAVALKAQLIAHGSTSAAEDDKKLPLGKALSITASTGLPSGTPGSPTSKKKVNFAATPGTDGATPTSGAASTIGDQSPVPAGSSPQIVTPAHTGPGLLKQEASPSPIPNSSGVSFASLAAGRGPSAPNSQAGGPLVQPQRQSSSVWGISGQESEDGAFPRLGSNTTDVRSKGGADTQPQDAKTLLSRIQQINSSPLQPAQGPAGTQKVSGSPVPPIQPPAPGYTVGRQASDVSQGAGSNPDVAAAGTVTSSSGANPQETQQRRVQDSETARLANVVDLNQLIGELSLEGMRSEVAGVAAGPGHYEGNPAASLELLQACCRRSMPQPADSDYKSDLSHHTNRVTPHLPASYPTTRLPQLDDPNFYQKMEQEGLFFSFYFQPGSIQQFAAAKDLKRQAWRYNIEHKAWFQRSGEPKATTKDYEQGSYIYFDKSLSPGNSDNPADVNGWCYRKKDNFTFRYDQLEDELQ